MVSLSLQQEYPKRIWSLPNELKKRPFGLNLNTHFLIFFDLGYLVSITYKILYVLSLPLLKTMVLALFSFEDLTTESPSLSSIVFCEGKVIATHNGFAHLDYRRLCPREYAAQGDGQRQQKSFHDLIIVYRFLLGVSF